MANSCLLLWLRDKIRVEREVEGIVEGLYQGPTDVYQEYGCMMSSLMRELTQIGEYLKVLLDSGGSIDHANPQNPHASEVRHRGSYLTPESELFHNPGRILSTPSQLPPDSENRP